MKIYDRLKEMTDNKAMATLKGQSWVSAKCGVRDAGKYKLEITRIEPIDGGVQVFARAWMDGRQIGFGKDGTVDIERFRFFNPPILVVDKDGDIRLERKTEDGGDEVIRMKEDADSSMLQAIERALDTKQEKHEPDGIIAGKVGKTTSVFYTVAGANSPCDGEVGRLGEATWGAARDASLASAFNSNATYIYIESSYDLGVYNVKRGILNFDTSSIPDTDVISSATFACAEFGSGVSKVNFPNVQIVSASPASTSDVTDGDFDCLGSQVFSERTLAATYTQPYPFDANGIAYINKSGVTSLGIRLSLDVSNTAPTGKNILPFRNADRNATHLSLTVEHSAVSGPANLKTINGTAKASVKSVNGTAIGSIKSHNGIN